MSIRLEQVSKHFDGSAAVSDASLEIADGELFVLLGPSGSGKSTLLRAIAGLTPIDHGRILLRGRDVTHLSAREREVGFVFQNYALFRHMTVADNIEFALHARRIPAGQRRRRREELLRLVALEGYDRRLPGELSGGQQQRVALARALAHEPRVLLLDEPFGALDAKIREELRRTIRQIQRTVGITTILVTHDQEEAFTMADRIAVMDRGRLQEIGTPPDLYARPATRFVATFLGAANLLLGRKSPRGVRLGESVFAADTRPGSLGDGEEVTALLRPEDLALAVHRASLAVPALGEATVLEMQFVGAQQRLRLSATPSAGLVAALRPGADEVLLEAVRSASEAESVPLTVGQQVSLGVRRIHLLPTPISSLRLIAASASDAEALRAEPLVRELAERMHIEPVHHRPVDGGTPDGVPGLPVVGLGTDSGLTAAIGLLEHGARQVLAIGQGGRRVQRMLIHVEPHHDTRGATLAAAASIVRHLALDVTLVVPAEERPRRRASFREILDLRSASQSHGLDARTETFHGEPGDAVRRYLEDGVPTVLVVGLDPSLATGWLADLCRTPHAPAAMLLVRGSGPAPLGWAGGWAGRPAAVQVAR